MTGYMTLVADCFGCGQLFTSNPNLVPSYQNQPICRNCIERANRERARNGLPLWPIPDGAYEPEETI